MSQCAGLVSDKHDYSSQNLLPGLEAGSAKQGHFLRGRGKLINLTSPLPHPADEVERAMSSM
ncbi:MAG TPA: hypothetical protein VEI01_01090 [Terriglobales bacterium]|nr:hypothetical protein [Terriglobales bacterium]